METKSSKFGYKEVVKNAVKDYKEEKQLQFFFNFRKLLLI